MKLTTFGSEEYNDNEQRVKAANARGARNDVFYAPQVVRIE